MASFPSIRIEGGLLGPDLLDQLVAGELPGQKPADFGLDARRNLTDEIAAVFADARALWGVFQNRLGRLAPDDIATTVTRDAWVLPFLGLLGYEVRFNQKAYEIDGMTFAVSHRAGEAEDASPVHIVGARQELGRLAPSGRPRLAPHSLVQEYLNRTEQVWGLVTNGTTLRVLRDSTLIRRQAYVEFDLAGIFEEQRFLDFAALYRLLYRTRLPKGLADTAECLLEKYYVHSVEQGGRVRDHLRDGVEQCITLLANGFLSHPKNEELRKLVREKQLTDQAFYRELLRLIYRFLFLLVSEDRGLLSPNPIYREHYGVARLRRMLDRRSAFTDHDDLWHGLRLLWQVLGKEEWAAMLELAPLNGELFGPQTLDACSISNRDLLSAFWYLACYQESPSAPSRRVNYAALDVEELGSVYESLLEFHPHVDLTCNPSRFELVVSGGERRSTGSHYTPPELVAPLIKYALDPVLSDRLAPIVKGERENAKLGERERTAAKRAILGMKVCDMACGSGHFLLAAARRLGKELARVETGESEPAPERVREAIREVVTHCIYGVDKNPLAVELCRVALWLESHEKGKPLTFLDHRIRCGDSLVGVFDLKTLEKGIPDEAFKPVAGDDKVAARQAKKRNAEERETGQRFLVFDPELVKSENLAVAAHHLDDLPEETPEQIHAKAGAFAALQQHPDFRRVKGACDLWTSAFFQTFGSGATVITTDSLRTALTQPGALDGRVAGMVGVTAQARRFIHWPLAFPEVMDQGGFDLIVGNPPFMGGLKISTEFGESYRHWISTAFTPFPGTADLCAAFFRRAFNALNPAGAFGLIATNTISQGDTREAGLAPIKSEGGVIVFAKRYMKWPGRASVEVNLTAVTRISSVEQAILDDRCVIEISSQLEDEAESKAQALQQNQNQCFIGDYVRGIGFALENDEAERLLCANPDVSHCLMPYLVGEDLNDDCQQKPARHAVCFHDFTLEQAERFPVLFSVVRERVKPFRDTVKEKIERECWWRYARYRGELRTAIRDLQRVMVRSRVSELHAVCFVPRGWVYSDATVVFAFDDNFHFALLQSVVHEAWVWKNASSLESRNRYTPTDCFETFAFPQEPSAVARADAERLGGEYYEHRRQTMLARQLGLTKTYNLFHKPDCEDADIVGLRELHAAMDRAVLACYGWTDVDPGHGFHVNDRGQIRYTISPTTRREVLRRLLALNLKIAGREDKGVGDCERRLVNGNEFTALPKSERK